MSLRTAYIIVFFAANLVVAGSITDLDEQLYTQIHTRWKSDFGDLYFGAVNELGNTEFVLAANLGIMAFGDSSARTAAKLASVGFAAAMLTTQILKCAVGRPRPDDPDCSRCKSSFPSGHATAAFTMAYIYGAEYPKYRIPLYAAAFSVALARIYLGRHYPSDVLAGAAVGTAAGIVVMKNREFVIQLSLF